MIPILWTFRRCPYAMRARLAVASSGVDVEHREILLRDKPAAFLAASPAGTVPVVEGAELELIHSLDIMLWALGQNDPEHLLDQPTTAKDLIERADTEFKTALDRYKYHVRIADADPSLERAKAMGFLRDLSDQMGQQPWLFGPRARLADLAILPFVRQFAHVDLDWFTENAPENLRRWLDDFKKSDRFNGIMQKRPVWQPDAISGDG